MGKLYVKMFLPQLFTKAYNGVVRGHFRSKIWGKTKKNQISILLHGRQKTDQNILVFGKSCFAGD